MRKQNNKLIDKVISSLDWDSIFEVNKSFKIGVGEGPSVIPGLKRKAFSESLTKADLKAELKALLKYVVDNDIAELFYGSWMIFWVNGEWIQIDMQDDDDDDDDDDVNMPGNPDTKSMIDVHFDSSLEVIYSPQRICVVGNSQKETTDTQGESDINRLEAMLKKALDSENYELAGKIKDLLSLQNGDPSGDK
jgi:hypothetical protein